MFYATLSLSTTALLKFTSPVTMLNLRAYLFRLLRYRLPIILHTFIEPILCIFQIFHKPMY